MSTSVHKKSEPPSHLPRPKIKKIRWPAILIWIVPLAAAVGAGIYLYQFLEVRGPTVTVSFDDGTGLEAGQTLIKHLGVQIGQVESIDLGPGDKPVYVKIRLIKSAVDFAKAGARFWAVRPEFSAENISGLATVISGPYIDCAPGSGDTVTEFTALEKPPVTLAPGLNVVLHTDHLEHLQADTPIYYRGIQVGVIKSVALSPDAAGVNVTAFIQQRFSPLVRTNSAFWIVSGVDVKGGLLTGVSVKVDSLRSLISGGIAFATPDKDIGPPATDGTNFGLYNDSRKEWLAWAPKIAIGDDDSASPAKPSDAEQEKAVLQSAVKGKGP